VPEALRDTHYSGAGKLGRGEGYAYAHDFAGGVADRLMTPDLPAYYKPTGRGYEKIVEERLKRWAEWRKSRPQEPSGKKEGS
jgi:putative ATPase